MARCKWGFLELFSGKLGEVVICHGKRGTYVRRLPQAPPKPPTAAQHTQRRRFASCVLFYRSLEAQGLAEPWRRAAREGKPEPLNGFIRRNLMNFTVGGEVSDFDRLCLTEGGLDFPAGFRVAGRSGECLEAEWEPAEYPWRGAEGDRLRAVVMTGRGSYGLHPADTGGARRCDCRATIRFPPEGRDGGHLYLYFEAEDGGDFSTTKHIEF